jgi:predicted small secreted protein
MMNKLLAVAAVAAVLAVLAGCNTVAGIGKDIQKAGDVVEEAATKKK